MNYMHIHFCHDAPFIEIGEFCDIDSSGIDQSMQLILHLPGFYDWIVSEGRIVGVHLYPAVESDIDPFREMSLSYVLTNPDEVIIWFTRNFVGETISVQNFDSHLVVLTSGVNVLVASLWNVDGMIIYNTSKLLEAGEQR